MFSCSTTFKRTITMCFSISLLMLICQFCNASNSTEQVQQSNSTNQSLPMSTKEVQQINRTEQVQVDEGIVKKGELSEKSEDEKKDDRSALHQMSTKKVQQISSTEQVKVDGGIVKDGGELSEGSERKNNNDKSTVQQMSTKEVEQIDNGEQIQENDDIVQEEDELSEDYEEENNDEEYEVNQGDSNREDPEIVQSTTGPPESSTYSVSSTFNTTESLGQNSTTGSPNNGTSELSTPNVESSGPLEGKSTEPSVVESSLPVEGSSESTDKATDDKKTSNTQSPPAIKSTESGSNWVLYVLIIGLVLALLAVFVCCILRNLKKSADEKKDLEKQDLTDGGSSRTTEVEPTFEEKDGKKEDYTKDEKTKSTMGAKTAMGSGTELFSLAPGSEGTAISKSGEEMEVKTAIGSKRGGGFKTALVLEDEDEGRDDAKTALPGEEGGTKTAVPKEEGSGTEKDEPKERGGAGAKTAIGDDTTGETRADEEKENEEEKKATEEDEAPEE